MRRKSQKTGKQEKFHFGRAFNPFGFNLFSNLGRVLFFFGFCLSGIRMVGGLGLRNKSPGALKLCVVIRCLAYK